MDNGTIVSEQGTTNPDTNWYDSQIEVVSGTMCFGVWPYALNTSPITSSIPTPFNQWHYVGFTYDGTTLKAYVNGQLAGTSTYARFTPFNTLTTGLHYALGYGTLTNMSPGGGGDFAHMRLGTFEVYNVALSNIDVLNNYYNSYSTWICEEPPTPTPTPTLIPTITPTPTPTITATPTPTTQIETPKHKLKRHGHNKPNNRGDRYVRNTKRSLKNIFHRLPGSAYNNDD